jgi:hypothetical protein
LAAVRQTGVPVKKARPEPERESSAPSANPFYPEKYPMKFL